MDFSPAVDRNPRGGGVGGGHRLGADGRRALQGREEGAPLLLPVTS